MLHTAGRSLEDHRAGDIWGYLLRVVITSIYVDSMDWSSAIGLISDLFGISEGEVSDGFCKSGEEIGVPLGNGGTFLAMIILEVRYDFTWRRCDPLTTGVADEDF